MLKRGHGCGLHQPGTAEQGNRLDIQTDGELNKE